MANVLVDTGRKLTALLEKQGDSADRRELVAEIHDFLAMLDGLKPVFLHGRGLAPPLWIEEVLELARCLGLCIVEGPFWDATTYEELPKWYADHCRAELAPYRAWSICLDEPVAALVQNINDASGRLSVTEEAQLLGYPECCVNAHYQRARQYHRGTLAILNRLAEGDESKMKQFLTRGANLAPATQDEADDFDAAFDIHEPQLGSWNMCPACARETNSASKILSRQYSEVIQKADLKFD
ncbi:MAG: hypothetical protein ACKVHX_03670 [Alphaproteobacteria bacterium]|jgi:hypothetical protein